MAWANRTSRLVSGSDRSATALASESVTINRPWSSVAEAIGSGKSIPDGVDHHQPSTARSTPRVSAATSTAEVASAAPRCRATNRTVSAWSSLMWAKAASISETYSAASGGAVGMVGSCAVGGYVGHGDGGRRIAVDGGDQLGHEGAPGR